MTEYQTQNFGYLNYETPTDIVLSILEEGDDLTWDKEERDALQQWSQDMFIDQILYAAQLASMSTEELEEVAVQFDFENGEEFVFFVHASLMDLAHIYFFATKPDNPMEYRAGDESDIGTPGAEQVDPDAYLSEIFDDIRKNPEKSANYRDFLKDPETVIDDAYLSDDDLQSVKIGIVMDRLYNIIDPDAPSADVSHDGNEPDAPTP